MINFLKKHWALIVLIIIGILYVKNNYLGINRYNGSSEADLMPSSGGGISLSSANFGSISNSYNYRKQVAPSESSDRIIIQDTSLSLQVKDVSAVVEEIENTTKEMGGFLINFYLSKPQDAASGSISVRIPEEKRKEAMVAFKKLAVKVVSESVNGNDVTDQYSDLQAQLEILQQTKVKYEDILNKATAVNDLLNVQEHLITLQAQIDSVKGQQKYYEQTAKLSKITIYLSTDELSLPYAPTNEWRPVVIFKEAVRSLVKVFRGLGSLIIWAVVFIPIIIPAYFIIRFIKQRKKAQSGQG